MEIYSRELESKKVDDLNTECHVFWAFNQDQLTEGMKKNPIENGDKFVSMGAGGFLPKSCVNKWIAGMKAITKWTKESKKNDKQVITYELNNYECFYQGDIEDAMPRLSELGYTREQVKKVFQSAKKLRKY